MKFIIIANLSEGTPGQEANWQYRRQRRIGRYGKLFKHRVAPGLTSSDPAKADKAHRTLMRITKSAKKWNMRGTKRGAGGRIRHEPTYMARLIGKYAKGQ